MPNYEAKETSKGGLFMEDNRKSDRAPHYRGNLKITRAQAKHIVEQFKGSTDQEFRVVLAGWVNQDKNGRDYISVQAETMPSDEPQGSSFDQAPAESSKPSFLD